MDILDVQGRVPVPNVFVFMSQREAKHGVGIGLDGSLYWTHLSLRWTGYYYRQKRFLVWLIKFIITDTLSYLKLVLTKRFLYSKTLLEPILYCHAIFPLFLRPDASLRWSQAYLRNLSLILSFFKKLFSTKEYCNYKVQTRFWQNNCFAPYRILKRNKNVFIASFLIFWLFLQNYTFKRKKWIYFPYYSQEHNDSHFLSVINKGNTFCSFFKHFWWL